jgi:hypothetical protein
VLLGQLFPMFCWIMLPSSESRGSRTPEDEGTLILQSTVNYQLSDVALYPRVHESSPELVNHTLYLNSNSIHIVTLTVFDTDLPPRYGGLFLVTVLLST